MTIPQDWADITPEWMTAALQRRHPGIEVATVTVLERDDGTNRRGRIGITYAVGSGPDVLFVKAEGPHREVHARNGNLFNEPELFASELPLPVDHPMPYHVVIDRPGFDYVILMEDVTRRGGDPRDATRPYTIDQVERGVRDLARLHAAYWDASLDFGWLQMWEPTDGWLAGLGPRVPVGLERGGDLLPLAVTSLGADGVLDHWVRAVTSYASGPMTLLHADAHIGNTYALPDGGVGFLDWQVTRRGNWSQDLAYFLVSALTIEDRRASERRLIDAYLEALPIDVDRDEAWLRYRASHAYGLAIWLSTLGTDGYQRRDVSQTLAERYGTAFADCDTASAMDQLALILHVG